MLLKFDGAGTNALVSPADVGNASGSHSPLLPHRFSKGSLKFEAAALLLLALTFAAILWGDSLRETRLPLIGSSYQFLPYTYSDANNGGNSSISIRPDRPFSFECQLRRKTEYPYCGYGLEYSESASRKGMDISSYDEIIVAVRYVGTARRLKLTLKNFDAAYAKAGHGDSAMPVVAEFDVKPGLNRVTLPVDSLQIDQWWIDSQGLSNGKAIPQLTNIVAVDIVSAGPLVEGPFAVSLEELTFTGILMSPSQWYLVVIAAWMLLAAVALVARFLSLRQSYEVRRQAQARESRELAQAREAAEAASTAKSKFLANMSHELRTPLNAILGYAQLLERSDIPDRQKAAVRTIHQSGSHLLTLITDILDISKIEAGKLDLMPSLFDLRQCIELVSNMVRLRAEEKGLLFVCNVDASVPTQVVGDAKRVRQILLNLLGNAVKFTDEGEVRLDVSVASWGGGDVRLRMDVVDSGTGIAPLDLPRLFTPFEQSGSVHDRSGGTGLGLAISRRLARAMNGDIDVQSEIGRGSRFSVEVQCALASEAMRDQRAPEIRGNAASLQILVVEDDADSRSLISQALESQGHVTLVAEDGAVALRMCAEVRPDFVVLDLKMPVLNGLATLGKLKSDPALRDIPVIVVSGVAGDQVEADALRAGATRFMSKPVDLSALSNAIIQDCYRVTAEPHAAHSPETLTCPSEAWLTQLLALAQAGDMRGIRQIASRMASEHEEYRPFADRVASLAASYQSPSVLRLIEANMNREEAA